MARQEWSSSNTLGEVLGDGGMVDDNQSELYATKTEVENARSGEATLLAKITSIVNSIAAILAGSGCPVSANDTTPGYLEGKLVEGNNITLTKNNDGGNETLTIDADTIRGNWSTLTGPLPAWAGCYHSDKLWLLTESVADATAVEPGVAAVWLEVSTGGGSAAEIALSNPTTFNSANSEYSVSVRLSATEVLVLWVVSSVGYAAIIDGQTPGAVFNFAADCKAGSVGAGLIVGTTDVAVTYVQSSDDDGYIIGLDCGGTVPSASTAAYEFKDAASIAYTTVTSITSDLVFVGYNNSGSGIIGGQVLDYTGTAFTSNTSEATIVSSADYLPNSVLLSGSASSAVIAFSFTTSSNAKIYEVLWNGTAFSSTGKLDKSNYSQSYVALAALTGGQFAAVRMGYKSAHGRFTPILIVMDSDFNTLVEISLSTYEPNAAFTSGSLIELEENSLLICLDKQLPNETIFMHVTLDLGSTRNTSAAVLDLFKRFPRYSSGKKSRLEKLTSTTALFIYPDYDNSSYGTTELVEVTI